MYHNISVSIRCIRNMITVSWLILFQSLLWPIKKQKKDKNHQETALLFCFCVVVCKGVCVGQLKKGRAEKSDRGWHLWVWRRFKTNSSILGAGVEVWVEGFFWRCFTINMAAVLCHSFRNSNSWKMTKRLRAREKTFLKRKTQMEWLDGHHSDCYQCLALSPLKNKRPNIVFQACEKVKDGKLWFRSWSDIGPMPAKLHRTRLIYGKNGMPVIYKLHAFPNPCMFVVIYKYMLIY